MAHREARLKEAAKLGFRQALCPAVGGAGRRTAVEGISVRALRDVKDLVGLFVRRPGARRHAAQAGREEAT